MLFSHGSTLEILEGKDPGDFLFGLEPVLFIRDYPLDRCDAQNWCRQAEKWNIALFTCSKNIFWIRLSSFFLRSVLRRLGMRCVKPSGIPRASAVTPLLETGAWANRFRLVAERSFHQQKAQPRISPIATNGTNLPFGRGSGQRKYEITSARACGWKDVVSAFPRKRQ